MTKRVLLVALCGGLMAAGGVPTTTWAQESEDAPIPVEVRSTVRSFGRPTTGRQFQDFNQLTQGAKTYEGFITLHEKDQHLYAEIKPQQLDQPILAPMVIARGSASAGMPLNFGDEWVLTFHRVGDKLQLIRKNIHFTAPAGTPLDKAVKQNYTDSILMALPILSISPKGGGLVIDFADIFMTDFAQVGFGFLDRNRSRWFKIRAYPENVEIQVEATFSGGRFGRYLFGFGESPVVDPRGITMVIALQPVQGPGPGLSSPDGRLSRRPLPQRRHRLRQPQSGHQRQADDQPLAAGEGQPPRQALASQEADRLVHRGQRAGRVPTLCPGGDPRVEQGLREDRLQGRHRRPLAERARRLRTGGHQLLHPALDHHGHRPSRCRASAATR